MRFFVIFNCLVVSLISCQSVSDSAGLLDDGSTFEISLTLVDTEAHFKFPRGQHSPVSEEIELSCDRMTGIKGVSYQCDDGNRAIQFIDRSVGRSKLVFFPLGVKVDRRQFFNCQKRHQTDDQKFFQCRAGDEVFPKPPTKLTSPIESTVEGSPIRNFHEVVLTKAGNGKVYRGMEPRLRQGEVNARQEYDFLNDAGVSAVLIFKGSEDGRDIATEQEQLGLGQKPIQTVKHIPFPWRDLKDFEAPCRQTVQAFRFIRDNAQMGKNIFFHCTVGEDRTGLLAGLVRLLDSSETSIREIYDKELCEHGYSSGNPIKPYANVSARIDDPKAGLTPFFLNMAAIIRSKRLAWDRLNEDVCRTSSQELERLSVDVLDVDADAVRWKCFPSTLFQ